MKATFVNNGDASALDVAVLRVSDFNLTGLKIELLKLNSSKFLNMRFIIDVEPPDGFAEAIMIISKKNAVTCTVEIDENVPIRSVAEILKEYGINKVKLMSCMTRRVGEVEF